VTFRLKCRRCGGLGYYYPYQQMTCETCHGAQFINLPGEAEEYTQCNRCNGKGYYYPHQRMTCDSCAGKGLLRVGAPKQSEHKQLLDPKDSIRAEEPLANTGDSLMKIFVSHSSKDALAAAALVELIRTASNIGSKDIRCTSVDGYKLPVGANADEVLRSEVFGCEAFIALLSVSSLASVYVMFEMGARWGSGRYLVPVRVAGMKQNELKSPLSAIHTIDGSSEAEIHQLLQNLAEHLKVELEPPAVYLRHLKALVNAASRA
jgi:hypothetical protein